MIKIDFEMTDGVYTYRDALHISDNDNFTDAEIEQMKQDRFLRWLSVLNNPPSIDAASDTINTIADDGVY